MKRILFVLLLACAPAWATTYYFSDCGTGADGACVAGNDANSGTSSGSPWKTSAKIQATFNGAQPGDQILLAKGGAWDNVAMTVYNTYAGTSAGNLATMKANPVIMDGYAPAWGAGTAKPRLNSDNVAGDAILNFYAGSPGLNASGGHLVRNLNFQSFGYINNAGISVTRWGRYINFDNLTINGFAGGFTCGGQVGYMYPSDIAIRNSTLTNNGKIALLMSGCSNYTAENLTLDNNGFDDAQLTAQDITRNHSIYVSGTNANDGSITTGVVLRHITMTKNSICPAVGTNGYNSGHTCVIGTCSSSVIVGHDWASDWVIEGNTVSNLASEASGGCFGLDHRPANGGYSEAMFRMVVRGNRFLNVGNTGIIVTACQTCTIENNLLIWESAAVTGVGGDVVNCIAAGHNAVSAAPSTTYQNQAITVRNNTCYIDHSSSGSNGVAVTSDGTGHVVASNLIAFQNANTGSSCVDITGLTINTNFVAGGFDYNLCYHAVNWTIAGQSLATWQGTAGTPDTHSTTSSPTFISTPSQANPRNAEVQAGSPAINAGHPTKSSRLAIDGFPAVGQRDIGAFEFGSNP